MPILSKTQSLSQPRHSYQNAFNFLNRFVRSRLTYACQNWSLTQQQLKKLDSTYTNFLRKMIRNGFRRKDRNPDDSINFSYHYSNNALYDICSTTSVSSYVQKSQPSNRPTVHNPKWNFNRPSSSMELISMNPSQ